jgi:hypothetical protein
VDGLTVLGRNPVSSPTRPALQFPRFSEVLFLGWENVRGAFWPCRVSDDTG